jgi:hypothetical protein
VAETLQRHLAGGWDPQSHPRPTTSTQNDALPKRSTFSSHHRPYEKEVPARSPRRL